MVKVSWYEELALSNIDALKEELVNMARKKHDNGRDSFDLIPEKAHSLNDDRAYCAAMAGWCLHELRRKEIIGKPKQSKDELLKKLTSSMRASTLLKR